MQNIKKVSEILYFELENEDDKLFEYVDTTLKLIKKVEEVEVNDNTKSLNFLNRNNKMQMRDSKIVYKNNENIMVNKQGYFEIKK